MNRREAIEYNEYLKTELNRVAIEYENDETFGSYIVDNYIMLIPESARKGMIFLGDETVSYKPGNIRIDLKNALTAGLELLVSLSRPESIFNYIQLLIASLFFIEKAAKVKIEKVEAYIVYILHQENVYNIGMQEEIVISKVLQLYKELNGKDIEIRQVVDAINRLYKIRAVNFDDGKILLVETVWMKRC